MTLRLRHGFVFALALIMSFGLALTGMSDTARATTRTPAPAGPTVHNRSISAVVKKTPRREAAYYKARTQKGDWYRYGGTGPSTWDCSGLVQWAYRAVGVSIPRTTGGMLGSSKFRRTSTPRLGDLAFFGSGHVELYIRKTLTFGAHKSGTRVGSRTYGSGYRPTVFLTLR